MFKRKKDGPQSEHATPQTSASADELDALLTRATPRRVPMAAEPAAPSLAANIPGMPADPRRSAPAAPPLPGRGSNSGKCGAEQPTEERKLIVGRDICLKGEVTSCDVLVVEGRVELSRTDAKEIRVASGASFHGIVDVREADIAGDFEGQLTARSRLTIRSGGRISGTVRYGNIIVEAGGELQGDVSMIAPQEAGDAGSANRVTTLPERPAAAATHPKAPPQAALARTPAAAERPQPPAMRTPAAMSSPERASDQAQAQASGTSETS